MNIKRIIGTLLASVMLSGCFTAMNVSAADTAVSLAEFKYTAESTVADHVIINQIYGGGAPGDSIVPVSHSFIELYNPTESSVDLNG